MSSQIVDVTLFCSKFSEPSIACVNFIKQNKIPVLIIPLDNEEDRATAMSGEDVKITSVPSLVIAFSDGKVQMFVGYEKIINWFTSTMRPPEQMYQNKGRENGERKHNNPSRTSQTHSPHRDDRVEDEQDDYDDPPPPPKKKRSKKKPKHRDDNNVELIMEDTVRPSKPPPPPTQGLSTHPKPNPSSKNLMNAAKEMENARNATLGIKQGDM
jgi:hypothetical protein